MRVNISRNTPAALSVSLLPLGHGLAPPPALLPGLAPPPALLGAIGQHDAPVVAAILVPLAH